MHKELPAHMDFLFISILVLSSDSAVTTYKTFIQEFHLSGVGLINEEPMFNLLSSLAAD